jgi:signal transduction histidine kinase
VSGLKTISVSIIDEGPGLGSKTSEELFRRFSRGSKSVAGSGLGLSIAKRISDLHAAQVSIFSQSPVGTKALFVIKKV